MNNTDTRSDAERRREAAERALGTFLPLRGPAPRDERRDNDETQRTDDKEPKR